MERIDLADEAATRALGEQIARIVRAGDLIALEGELGAGKTTLVRGLSVGLGIDPALVSSPTFVNRHDYPGTTLALAHVDGWRIESKSIVDSLGLDEAIEVTANCVVVVEWASRVIEWIPRPTMTVRIVYANDGATRVAEITHSDADKPINLPRG